MKSTVDRYKHLAEAYIKLSDQFQQLDVAHMALKEKVVPVLKALKKYQTLTVQLKQDKIALVQTIQALTDEKMAVQAALVTLQAKYDAIAELEALLQPETQDLLAEAEQQIDLVEETLKEMAVDSDPNLSQTDKQLLETYQNNTESLVVLDGEGLSSVA
jgi:hypothetical protein